MRYEELFPSRFIRSVDLKGKDVTLTIASIKGEKIETKLKAIVGFKETEREWVMNRTCAEALNLMWGPEVANWIGRKVTLFPETMKDPFGDGMITAIRVRGSPEITKAQSATVQRGRKTIRVAVQPTGKKASGKAAPVPPDDKVPVSVDDLPQGDPPGLPPMDESPFGLD